jgi:hypothetical protein
MDIEQNISGHGLERIGDVQRIRPSVAKKLAEMLMMLGNDFLVEIGNFPRQFRAGEIEDEGARDDRHLDREKLVVVQNKLRDVMTGDLSNLFFGNQSIDREFSSVAINAVKKLNSRPFRGAPDYTILPDARAQLIYAQSPVTKVVL